uniref:Sugar ABC transporter permease n=1 Tax=Anaerolinea thermolimosa TaxID=229919 RepID=A0A7C4PNF6_9CHLR
MTSVPSMERKRMSKSRLSAYFYRTWPLYFMVIPALVLLIIFNYGPMYGVIIAFQNYNPGLGFTGSPWVGLKNFNFLFHLPQFKLLIRNTLVIAVSKILSLQLCAIALALILNEVRSFLFKRVINTILYLPYFLSWVVLGGILLDMLSANGLIGQLLKQYNINSFIFLGDAKVFPVTVVVTHIWKDVGFAVIVYLAALTGIDPALQEAAAVDGANRWQRIWHITLPGILPTIILIACLNLGSVLDAGFDQLINLYNPSVYATGDILDTYVYRAGLISAKYSLAAAVGLFKSTIGLFLILTSYWLANKFAGFRVF